MQRRLAVFVLLPLLAGCYAGTRVSGNRSYLNDGYKYEGPLGKFVHSEDENRNEMWIGYGFDEKKLIDEGCDGTLDEIRFKGSTYRRDDAERDSTVTELFAQASAEYNRYYDSMFVHEIHENWTGWKAYGVARENGYFKK